MASFAIKKYTDASVTIEVTGISKGQTVRFYIREDPDPGYSTVDKNYTASTTHMKKTFSGLSADTEYACNVKVDDDWIGAQYFTTDSAISVEEWSWTSSNGNASASQTKVAYNAVANKGSIDNFSYLVWNDMVDKVYEILDAIGDSWSAKYASYTLTKMSSADKLLTAKRFNSLKHNIELRHSTGIGEVSNGDTVYGWYFRTLANCINSWIGTL